MKEELFKDRFANEQSTAGVDAEALWSAVASSVQSPAPSKRKRRFLWIPLIGLGLLAGLPFVWKGEATSTSAQHRYRSDLIHRTAMITMPQAEPLSLKANEPSEAPKIAADHGASSTPSEKRSRANTQKKHRFVKILTQ